MNKLDLIIDVWLSHYGIDVLNADDEKMKLDKGIYNIQKMNINQFNNILYNRWNIKSLNMEEVFYDGFIRKTNNKKCYEIKLTVN